MKEKEEFRTGDVVRVFTRAKEKDKKRRRVFEGIVIRRRKGTQGSFTVRKVSYGVGVERTFPFDSPGIESIEIRKRGKGNRARLYYLRRKK